MKDEVNISDILIKSEHPVIQEFINSRRLNLEDCEPKYIKELRRTLELDDEHPNETLQPPSLIQPVELEEEYEVPAPPTLSEILQDLAKKLLWKVYMLHAQYIEDTSRYDSDIFRPRRPLSIQDRVMMRRITKRLKAILESKEISDEKKEEAINNFMRHSMAFTSLQ